MVGRLSLDVRRIPTCERLPHPEVAEYLQLLALSPSTQGLGHLIQEVARTDATVLVRGESGVGKNVVARAIHAMSPRRDKPFVLVNCAALPAELLETELFGHEKGAFTGAHRRRVGQFEFADGGTICLDEIGELPRSLQAKLLHVLQDLQFSRVGGQELIRADVRVVATTNRDLDAAMRDGEFRADLYYRLYVVEIHVSPLRECREMIPGLAQHFLSRSNRQYQRSLSLSPDLVALMEEYHWPGNVRELENCVRRLVVLGNPERAREELASRVAAARRRGLLEGLASQESAPLPPTPVAAEPAGLDLKEIARCAARKAERKAILEVLDTVHWNRAAAARILKVSYKTLLNKLTECGIRPPRPVSSAPPAVSPGTTQTKSDPRSDDGIDHDPTPTADHPDPRGDHGPVSRTGPQGSVRAARLESP
jgi:two-component system response regulator AtoC